jgi:protein SCO1/2
VAIIALLLPLPLVALGIARWRAAQVPPVFWPVPAFTLLDQDSAAFSSDQLRGRVWLASFVYTNCPDVCPLVTERMAALRDSLQRKGRLGEVRLLSVSVDPLRDSPSVLRNYAVRLRAQKPDWVFLTGPLEAVIPLVSDGFHLTAIHPAHHDEYESSHTHDQPPADYVVNHSDRIVLIDREGQVRGTYVASDPEALARLRRDLRIIL